MKNISESVLFVLSSTILQKLAGFLVFFIILNYLEPEQAGLFFIVYSFSLIIASIADFGIGTANLRFVAKLSAHKDKNKIAQLIKQNAIFIFISAFVFYVLLFVSAPFIEQYYNLPISQYFRLFSIFVFFQVMVGFLGGLLRGLHYFKKDTSIAFIGLISRLFLIIYFFFFVQKNVENVFISFIGSHIIALILYLITIAQVLKQEKIKMDLNFRFDKDLLKKEIAFGLPVYISIFIISINTKLDVLFLGFFKTAVDVAIYTASIQIARNAVFIISSAVNSIFSPVLSKIVVGDKKEINKTIDKNTNWMLVLGIPFIFVFLSFPYQIMSFFYPKYIQGAYLIYPLILGFASTMVAAPFRNLLFAKGKTKVFVMFSIASLLINSSLMLFMVPAFGMTGAAVSTLFSIIVSEYLFVYFAKKEENIEIQWKKILMAFGFGFLILVFNQTIIYQFFSWMGKFIFIACIIDIPLYILFFYKIGIIDKEIVEMVRKYESNYLSWRKRN